MRENDRQYWIRQEEFEMQKRQKDEQLLQLQEKIEASTLQISSLESDIAALQVVQTDLCNQVKEEAQSAIQQQEASAMEMISSLEAKHISELQAKQDAVAALQADLEAKQSEISATLGRCKASDVKVAKLKNDLNNKVEDEAQLKSQNEQAKLYIIQLETKITELESSNKDNNGQAEPSEMDERHAINAETIFKTSGTSPYGNPENVAANILPLPVASNEQQKIENTEKEEACPIPKPKQSNSRSRNARRIQGISKQSALMVEFNTYSSFECICKPTPLFPGKILKAC